VRYSPLSDAASAVAAAFELGTPATLAGPVARGEQGQVWRLETPRGTWAVKETFERTLTDEEIEEAASFQEAARAAGVPAPAVVRTPDGAVECAIGETAAVRVYEWVDLGAPRRLVDPADIGRLLAAVHGVGFAGMTPQHPWYTEPVGEDRWRALVDELVSADGPHAERIAAYAAELIALESLLEPPARLATCHRDLWADNVLPTPAGGLCVIDWDNCGLAGPDQELAMVLFEFGAGDASRTRALHDAYREAGGPGRVQRPGDFSLTIAQLGHIGARAIALWLDPMTPGGDRARHADRIEELVTPPLTRDGIDAILEAVAP
jgi:Ser/Thr protein kinase RdoA (MazF antagonist)